MPVFTQSHHETRFDILTPHSEVRDACKVLVVDDDVLVRARLSALLAASGYDVHVAATGEEALKILETTQCNVVLTDWQMPDMDGLALCRHIRLRRHERYVYVLMLTVRNSELDVMNGLAAGADAYMVKGGAINDILARLEIGRRITHETFSGFTKHGRAGSLSSTDPVTGAHNLRYLLHHLPRELARSQRHGHPLAVLHCKIEGFDRLKDRIRREAGDDLLRAFIAATDDCIRRGDWLARTEGNTFMIVLPETAAKGAHRVAQKLRERFAAHPISAQNVPLASIVSIGVIVVDTGRRSESEDPIEAILRAAVHGTHANALRIDGRSGAEEILSANATRAPLGELNGLN